MRVVVAGTFGPVHDGHRALFEAALRHGDDGVVVGLTSDDLAVETRSEPRPVPPFDERRSTVVAELEALDDWGRAVEIQCLDTKHGIATDDPSLDAIVVSTETADAVPAINRKRRDNGLHPLTAIVVPMVRAIDGERISSTRMVHGEIDEHGVTACAQNER